jgi:CheY-like chemotaxis protein
VTKVLLIDDTPEILELLTFSLRDHGYDVAPSGFTPDVIELLGEQKAEALVLDCTSYEMSEALFDAVRDHGDFGALPVVIISDTPEKADASLRQREAEHVLLIPKPFAGSTVARALGELLKTE